MKISLEAEITNEGKKVYLQILIRKPYDNYVEFKGSIPLNSKNKEETIMKLGNALPQIFKEFKEIILKETDTYPK